MIIFKTAKTRETGTPSLSRSHHGAEAPSTAHEERELDFASSVPPLLCLQRQPPVAKNKNHCDRGRERFHIHCARTMSSPPPSYSLSLGPLAVPDPIMGPASIAGWSQHSATDTDDVSQVTDAFSIEEKQVCYSPPTPPLTVREVE